MPEGLLSYGINIIAGNVLARAILGPDALPLVEINQDRKICQNTNNRKTDQILRNQVIRSDIHKISHNSIRTEEGRIALDNK